MPASPKSTKSIQDSEYNAVKSQIKLEEDQQPFGNKSSTSSIFTFPTDQVQFNTMQQHCEAMALEQQRCNQQQIANENFLSQCNMLSKGKIVAIHLNNHQTSNHYHQIDNHELITTSTTVSNSTTNSTNSTTTITSTNLNNNNANNNIITATTITTSDVVQQPSSIVYETIIVENNNNNHHLTDNTTNTSIMTTNKLSSSTTGGIVVLTNASLSELLNSGNDGSTTAKEKLTIINDSSKKPLSQSILMINSGSLNTAVSSSGTVATASGTPIMATNQLTGQKQIMFLNNNQVYR